MRQTPPPGLEAINACERLIAANKPAYQIWRAELRPCISSLIRRPAAEQESDLTGEVPADAIASNADLQAAAPPNPPIRRRTPRPNANARARPREL